jgi:serine protease Do
MDQADSPTPSPSLWMSPPGGSTAGGDLVARRPAFHQEPEEHWAPRQPAADDNSRLGRLLWIFALLTIVLVTPSIIGRIEYSLTAARERARLDVARENLKDFNLEQISAAYRMIAQIVSPSVVNIRTERGRAEGQGSGVIVDDAGFIVTNNHVVDGVRTAEIQLSDGRRGAATVVGVDPLTDIAVLKTEMSDLVAAEWGDSNHMEVGDLVWAVGSPFGLQKSITSGILSAKERRGFSPDVVGPGSRVIQEFLQTDAAVNPGNSGGPLVDIHGQVIGINTAIIGLAYQGVSFAVPSELAKASYEQLRDHGYVLRGFLGVQPEIVPDELARELELEQGEGVWVMQVTAGTPAAEAGVKANDVILSWNGEEFSDPTLLSRAIAGTPIGSDVPMTLVRTSPAGPRVKELKVKVAARPPDE